MARRRLVAGALAVAAACGAFAPGAWAAPSTPRTLTYVFGNCEGPAGTPSSFTAVKQPGEAAALHVENGGGTFVLMEAFDPSFPDEPFFTVPGFDRSAIELVTCDLVEPVFETHVTVRGLLTPARPRK